MGRARRSGAREQADRADAGLGRLDEYAAVPAESGVLQDPRPPGPDPGAGTAQRARVRGGRNAPGSRHRARPPFPAARRAAPREPGHLPQGRLQRPLLADQPARGRAAGRGPADPDRGAVGPGRAPRRPAGLRKLIRPAPVWNRTVDRLLPCMPDGVALGLITAVQLGLDVWLRRAVSAISGAVV